MTPSVFDAIRSGAMHLLPFPSRLLSYTHDDDINYQGKQDQYNQISGNTLRLYRSCIPSDAGWNLDIREEETLGSPGEKNAVIDILKQIRWRVWTGLAGVQSKRDISQHKFSARGSGAAGMKCYYVSLIPPHLSSRTLVRSRGLKR